MRSVVDLNVMRRIPVLNPTESTFSQYHYYYYYYYYYMFRPLRAIIRENVY